MYRLVAQRGIVDGFSFRLLLLDRNRSEFLCENMLPGAEGGVPPNHPTTRTTVITE